MTKSRSLENSIALHAPVPAVWRALTEAEGLKRWFGLDARVEPGVGGSIWISFGAGSDGASAITIWEPNRHLRTEMPGPPGSEPFAVDYILETRGDTTVLRLVTSGFGAGSDWDEMYDGMDAGWSYFLVTLQLALEQHGETPRAMALERRRVGGTRAEAWLRLREGMGVSPAAKVGDGLTFGIAGERLEGRLVVLRPERCVAAILPSLNHGIIMFEQEPGAEQWKLGAYLSMYGVPPARVEKLSALFPAAVTALVGPPTEPQK